MIQDDYGVVSDEILYDIAYAINVNAPNFGSTEWLTKRMQELGRFNAKQRNRIYNVAYSNDLTTLAWKTLRDIEHEFPQTKGIMPRDERVRLTVRAVANQTSQYFGVLNATMLRSADQLYQTALTEVERRMLLATEAVMTGMATKMSVTKDVIDLVQKLGITGFIDKSGRKWSAEAYADLVTRSSMGNIQRQIMVDRCHDYGEDIVYAPIKFPSRPLCADWQGKLLSLSEQHYFTNDLYDRRMEVFPYSDAVGHPAGLWGCNCGHGHAVFIPNLSEVVKPVNQMTPEQNAEAYALTQQERQLERNVRNNKTKVKMLEKAGVTGDDLDQAKNKLKQSRANYREFLNRYGYDPTAGRTYVHGFGTPRSTGGGGITFSEKLNGQRWDDSKKLINTLAQEYKTKLKEVGVGADKGAGSVQISGSIMRLSSTALNVALHEFAHTISLENQTRFGLYDDSAFWKEVKKVQRQYRKDVGEDVSRWISTYEHASKGSDEFLAEAFTQAKAHELGIVLPPKYGKDLTYSSKVLEIVDKYFKKRRR